jgi:hypothetical protein
MRRERHNELGCRRPHVPHGTSCPAHTLFGWPTTLRERPPWTPWPAKNVSPSERRDTSLLASREHDAQVMASCSTWNTTPAHTPFGWPTALRERLPSIGIGPQSTQPNRPTPWTGHAHKRSLHVPCGTSCRSHLADAAIISQEHSGLQFPARLSARSNRQ